MCWMVILNCKEKDSRSNNPSTHTPSFCLSRPYGHIAVTLNTLGSYFIYKLGFLFLFVPTFTSVLLQTEVTYTYKYIEHSLTAF